MPHRTKSLLVWWCGGYEGVPHQTLDLLLDLSVKKFVSSLCPQPLEPLLNSAVHSNNLDDQPQRKQGISMVSADMGLVSMVRQGILALQLLPPNSSAGRVWLCEISWYSALHQCEDFFTCLHVRHMISAAVGRFNTGFLTADLNLFTHSKEYWTVFYKVTMICEELCSAL